MALRFDQSIYDDRFATTCWAHKHGRVPGHHGFVHLHHFVFLCTVHGTWYGYGWQWKSRWIVAQRSRAKGDGNGKGKGECEGEEGVAGVGI